MTKYKRYKKPFWITLFSRQNKHHNHGVLGHTLKVVYHVIKKGHYRMILAALLHDIAKPLVAYQKPYDVLNNEYSFTNHEEAGYHLIKNWYINDYTKNIIRYHYHIRGMGKAKKNNPKKYRRYKREWDNLPLSLKKDLGLFLVCDDLGKKKGFSEATKNTKNTKRNT